MRRVNDPPILLALLGCLSLQTPENNSAPTHLGRIGARTSAFAQFNRARRQGCASIEVKQMLTPQRSAFKRQAHGASALAACVASKIEQDRCGCDRTSERAGKVVLTDRHCPRS